MWPKQLLVLVFAAGLVGCFADALQSPKLDVIAVLVASMNRADDAHLANAKADLVASTQKIDSDLEVCRKDAEAGCQPEVCREDAEAGCQPIDPLKPPMPALPGHTSEWGFPMPAFPNMYAKETKEACVESTREIFCGDKDLSEGIRNGAVDSWVGCPFCYILKAIVNAHDSIVNDSAKISEDKSQIANLTAYRSSQYIMTLVKSEDYEGNIISYVKVRTKGTDDTELDKVIIRRQNNSWVVVSSEVVNQVPE